VGDRGSGRPTWAEIDLSALAHNLARLRARAPGRRVIAVVKANGYGHGAHVVGPALAGAGADALAVVTLAEAADLRAGGIERPILLLQGLHAADEADFAHELGLSVAVGRLDTIAALEAAAERAGRPVAVHLKFDTGMARLGFDAGEVDAVLDRVLGRTGLDVQGLMSHLATADDPASAATDRQRAVFAAVVSRAAERGLRPPWIHLDNSPAVLHRATDGTTAFRPGLALYGADPTLDGAGVELEPVMSLCSQIADCRDVPAGTAIGYGGGYVTAAATRIATVPLGYADGLPRAAAEGYAFGLGEKRVRLAGRVSMDLCALDVGSGGDVEPGDEVLVFGRRHGLTLPVEELARICGTISYEILVGIGGRIPRVAVRRAE
jgi:alanine racemase